MLHQFLVSPTERFLARLRVLAWGFWLALRSLRGARDQVSSRPGGRALGAVRTALGDWRSLDQEHAFAVRHLLLSLSAEPGAPAPAAVKRPSRISGRAAVSRDTRPFGPRRRGP